MADKPNTDNLAYLELKDGRVTIELRPDIEGRLTQILVRAKACGAH